jgi:hypothetical protein
VIRVRARLGTVLIVGLVASVLVACGNDQPDSPAERRARERQTVERIRLQVATVRGLKWKEPLDVRIVSRRDLQEELKALAARDARPERDQADEEILKLLDLIPDELDLESAIENLLDAQVVGFYDPETKRLFVAGETDGKLSPDTQITVAHELDHALTDQHFGFGAFSDALDADDRQEELLAYTALIEGDAVLLQSLWAQRYLDDAEHGSLGAELGASGLGAVPRYLRESLVFPYTSGLDFAFERYRTTRSFAGVNAAWQRPPTSSEEILHPGRYAEAQQWQAPALPDLSATAGCLVVRTGTLGEFDMRQLLVGHLTARDAERAVDAWAGDAFAFVRCGESAALIELWRADDVAAASRLDAALSRWARAWSGGRAARDRDGDFVGPDGAGRIVRDGVEVSMVLSDDADTAERLAQAVGQM